MTSLRSRSSFPRLLAAACAASFTLAGACKNDQANEQAKRRLWGREAIPDAIQEKAQEKLDPTLLSDQGVAKRVLSMTFEEVVARIGFVEYHGIATIKIGKGARTLEILEDTTIQQGLHGDFRVLQRDKDGNTTREAIFHNGVLYIRNGGGQMRVQGIVKDQHHVIRDEAWQPLRVFTGYYGPRLALSKLGHGEASGRGAMKYSFTLVEGPDLVPDPAGVDSPKRPRRVSGSIFVDDETSVPLKVELTGVLEVPADKPATSTAAARVKDEPGEIEIDLQFELKAVEGQEIKPGSFVPTIKRHPADLDPLSWIDGGVRSSTVIGGPRGAATGTASRPKGPRVPVEEEEEEP